MSDELSPEERDEFESLERDIHRAQGAMDAVTSGALEALARGENMLCGICRNEVNIYRDSSVIQMTTPGVEVYHGFCHQGTHGYGWRRRFESIEDVIDYGRKLGHNSGWREQPDGTWRHAESDVTLTLFEMGGECEGEWMVEWLEATEYIECNGRFPDQTG